MSSGKIAQIKRFNENTFSETVRKTFLSDESKIPDVKLKIGFAQQSLQIVLK